MAEVAVAVLDVDEREPGPLRQPRGPDEVVDQPGDLVVGEDAGRRRSTPSRRSSSGWR